MIYNDPQGMKSAIDTWVATTPLNLLIGGHFAVCIFFVLSGHVLTRKHVGKQQRIQLVSSMAKRYPRLGIPIFFSVFLNFILLWISAFLSRGGLELSESGQRLLLSQIVSSFNRALVEATTGAILYGSNTFNGVFWTMDREFYGSLCVLLSVYLFGSISWHWRVVVYLVAIVFSWQGYYLAFVLGLLLTEALVFQSQVFRHIGKRRWLIAVLLVTGLMLGSIPVYFLVWDGTIYSYVYQLDWPKSYHIIGAFLVLLAVISSEQIREILISPFFKFLGDISFSMYLVHGVVLQYFGLEVVRLLAPHLGHHWAAVVALPPMLGVVALVSRYFNLWVDQPAIQIANLVAVSIVKRASLPHSMRRDN